MWFARCVGRDHELPSTFNNHGTIRFFGVRTRPPKRSLLRFHTIADNLFCQSLSHSDKLFLFHVRLPLVSSRICSFVWLRWLVDALWLGSRNCLCRKVGWEFAKSVQSHSCKKPFFETQTVLINCQNGVATSRDDEPLFVRLSGKMVRVEENFGCLFSEKRDPNAMDNGAGTHAAVGSPNRKVKLTQVTDEDKFAWDVESSAGQRRARCGQSVYAVVGIDPRTVCAAWPKDDVYGNFVSAN